MENNSDCLVIHCISCGLTQEDQKDIVIAAIELIVFTVQTLA